jgi:hypothetical protein
MKVEDFKAVIGRLSDLYEAAGASAAVKDLQGINRLLDGHEKKSIDEFVGETRELLDRSGKNTEAAPNEAIVNKYGKLLLAAGLNQSEFNALLSTVDSDKQVTKKEWFAIANLYRNSPTGGTHSYKYGSIKDAKSAINDAFINRFEAESKRGIIDRLTTWAS